MACRAGAAAGLRGAGRWPRQLAALSRALANAGTVGLLNDLVLLFKYAALDRSRPLQRVADLYRLGRALTDRPGPAAAADVERWLAGPLIVPAPFTRQGTRGAARAIGSTPPESPTRPTRPIDLTTPEAAHVLGRLDAEIEKRSSTQRAETVRAALNAAGILDRDLVHDILEVATGGIGDRDTAVRRAATAPPSWTPGRRLPA